MYKQCLIKIRKCFLTVAYLVQKKICFEFLGVLNTPLGIVNIFTIFYVLPPKVMRTLGFNVDPVGVGVHVASA